MANVVLAVVCPHCQATTIIRCEESEEKFRCSACGRYSLFFELRLMRPWPGVDQFVRPATERETKRLDRQLEIERHERALRRLRKV